LIFAEKCCRKKMIMCSAPWFVLGIRLFQNFSLVNTMMKRYQILMSEELDTRLDALHCIRRKVQWKPEKGIIHLNKRQKMKHLPPAASLLDYEKMISDLVKNGQNIVYLYEFTGIHYYTVRGFVHSREWLVIFGTGGVMETAFPPENIDDYLEKRGFVILGPIEEVLKWTR